MPGVSPTGNSGSTIDVEGLVNKLVKAEGAPTQNRLDQQEVKLQTNISALGTFRGALSDFQQTLGKLRNASDLRKIAASSSNEDKIEISAGVSAQEGVYNAEALQLAQAQRLTSEAFENDLAPIGKGNLSFQFGSIDPVNGQFIPNPKATVKNIIVNDDNNSVRGIKEAVNQGGFGVRASLINDGKGTRLVFSAEGTGEINAMRIVVTDADGNGHDHNGLSRLSYDPTQPNRQGINMIESAQAQDAVLRVDGIEISSPTNTFDKAIDGVTIKLKDVTENQAVKLTAKFDEEGVNAAIGDFVKAYNEMINNVQTIAGYDPETKKAGPLAGDASVRGIVEQIRRTIGTSYNVVNEDYGSLASIGIDTQRDGTLSINTGKLQNAVRADMLQVSKLFARAGAASDPLIRYLGADENSQMGAYDVNISQLATQGHYIGAESSLSRNFKITDGENKMTLKVDGVTSGQIQVAAGQYNDGREMAEVLQRAINNDEVFKREGISVDVKYLADQFVLSSKRVGSASRVDVLAAEDGIQDLGIDPAEGLPGEDVRGTIGGQPATGNGQILTGRGAASGIQIEVLGGKTGARGQVTYARGVAEQLGGMFDTYLGSQGLIDSRNKGMQDRIEQITHQREQLARRLAVSEQRLMKQYSDLDATLGRMRNTSDYLSNQLKNLPGAGSSKS